ncbi:thiosulfate dehydrogenase [quinone] large subunit [Sediminihabitans luteus]|uniref:Thiosulfate dehydrogenase [quinone] large subunit n=1 Tax=Sediminihabitans luteus TaxID=1138585 RepID=A0A2M9CPC1_9CELL|nr:DoxX family membrane protein [Sediminihabitans luteus]PJJ73751.1 thiosulfate dehydrogenase [quinone] large subunit [Sediminihabitans luteus]GIJ00520.1 membrane protein [Sediminihabitans luteus]
MSDETLTGRQTPAPATDRPAPATATAPQDDPTGRTVHAAEPGTTALPPRSVALLRIALAVVFLWPVADKTFGLGYATPSERAWVAGAPPTQGYLANVSGPAADVFASMAGPVTDWAFMLGMLATGLALLLGIGLRVAACSGVALMALLWVTAWPVAPGSHNPIVDEHVLVAIAVVAMAATRAGDRWGLGRAWAGSGIPGARGWMR